MYYHIIKNYKICIEKSFNVPILINVKLFKMQDIILLKTAELKIKDKTI